MTSGTKKDPAWNYAQQIDPTNKDKFQCNFCSKITNGGVFRVKQHLVGGLRNVKGCTEVPIDVKREIEKYMSSKKQENETIDVKQERVVHESLMSEDHEDNVELEYKRSQYGSNATSSEPSGSSFSKNTEQTRAKGLLDWFTVQGRNENDGAKKKMRNKACMAIARWIYDAGLPFSVVNYDSFEVMIEAIGQCGQGVKPPSYHEVKVPLLKKEVGRTNDIMKDHETEWEKNGCSIICDGWEDKRGRTLIYFLVNSLKGSFFLESVNESEYSKTGEKLNELKMYGLICDYVEKVGPSNVVQVVTDSEPNNKLAGKFVEIKYPHIFWTPCVAHCLNLILEDIFNIRAVKKMFSKAVFLSSYIYTRPEMMNMLRHFTQEKELLRPAKTRFTTNFITLSRIRKQKNNLRKMFTSEKWTNSKYAKESVGKKASEIVLTSSFWNNVVYALKVASPLIKLLRLVDGEKKPAMGYVYKAMDNAKEDIKKSFNDNESKYQKIFEIIDKRWEIQLHQPLHAAGYYLNPEFFYTNTNIEQDAEVKKALYACISKLVPDIEMQDKICCQLATYRDAGGLFGTPLAKKLIAKMAPVSWWASFGTSAVDLQNFAIKVLSLTCSASRSEKNWSVIDHLYIKKRNPLDQARLNDLMFVKYNRALRRRYALRDSIDPISLNDIDESNEWLVGRLDGESKTSTHILNDDDDDMDEGKDDEEQEFEGEDLISNYDADFDGFNLQDELDDIEDDM